MYVSRVLALYCTNWDTKRKNVDSIHQIGEMMQEFSMIQDLDLPNFDVFVRWKVNFHSCTKINVVKSFDFFEEIEI